jgi:hypothetical protein
MQLSVDQLGEMLSRLKLAGIRDQLESLLDEAARSELDMRQKLALCASGRSHARTGGASRWRSSWRTSLWCAT